MLATVATFVAAFTVALPLAAQAPSRTYTAQDSALVRRILLAEDAREAAAPALAEGRRHRDPWIAALAVRAHARIVDQLFARRDSLPGASLPAPPPWPEPDWKPRLRALTAARDDCAAIHLALRDRVVAVQLRAAAVVRASCARDAQVLRALMQWTDSLPADVRSHARGQASWQLAAHGLLALARLQPDSAAPRIHRLAAHPQWQLRQYAARAAAETRDSATLRRLATDGDANVVEAAVEGLHAVTAHASDSVYLAVLAHGGTQAVRVAALALKDSPHPAVRAAATAALERYARRGIASERDVRVALLALLGRPAADDPAPPRAPLVGEETVALALGAERQLEVLMAPEHGGGWFRVRLRGDVAPIMASRILELATAGHFDNASWHRVEHDFVIQGGHPGANEYVGAARFLRDELGTVPHARGTVGMSTRGHDTGDTQWFINLRDNLRLGRDYTVFAEVVEGMDVVDAVLEGDRIVSIRPVRP